MITHDCFFSFCAIIMYGTHIIRWLLPATIFFFFFCWGLYCLQKRCSITIGHLSFTETGFSCTELKSDSHFTENCMLKLLFGSEIARLSSQLLILLSAMCAKVGISTDSMNFITCQKQFITGAFSMTASPSPEWFNHKASKDNTPVQPTRIQLVYASPWFYLDSSSIKTKQKKRDPAFAASVSALCKQTVPWSSGALHWPTQQIQWYHAAHFHDPSASPLDWARICLCFPQVACHHTARIELTP